MNTETTYDEKNRNRKAHLGNIVGDFIRETGKKVENVVENKKETYFREAEDRAEDFVTEKMDQFEKRVDSKIIEIQGMVENKISEYEKRLDEQIIKEVNAKLRVLKITILGACGIMILGLLLQWGINL